MKNFVTQIDKSGLTLSIAVHPERCLIYRNLLFCQRFSSAVCIFFIWHTGVMQVKCTCTLNCNTESLLKIQICAVLGMYKARLTFSLFMNLVFTIHPPSLSYQIIIQSTFKEFLKLTYKN